MSRGDDRAQVVRDDDERAGSFGIVTISELRTTTLEDALEDVRCGVDELCDEFGITDPATRTRLRSFSRRSTWRRSSQ
jgi:hypothetical protein